jgi:hypothetical protein
MDTGRAQRPALQMTAQRLPQEPQFISSDSRAVHAPEQTSGSSTGHVQVPERQTAPPGHALSQAPQ